ncbi:MAG: hypothetical protein IAE83_14510 [Anaerolinea sp.]|nr:hypothetical protein [Anaerolinea sp.]
MHAVRVRGHVGPDGLLKLELQVDAPNQDIEAIVVLELPAPTAPESPSVDALGYPVGFFERIDQMPGTALSERPDQGVGEQRDRLE